MDRERVALYVGTVAAYSDMYVTQPILPLLSRELGVGPARAGQAGGWSAVVATCAASVCLGIVANAALCGRGEGGERDRAAAARGSAT